MRWVTEYLLKVFVRFYVSSNYYGNITNYPNSSTSAFGKLSEWTVCFTEKHLSLKTPCKNRLINYRELCHSVPINVQGIRVGMRLGISETIFFWSFTICWTRGKTSKKNIFLYQSCLQSTGQDPHAPEPVTCVVWGWSALLVGWLEKEGEQWKKGRLWGWEIRGAGDWGPLSNASMSSLLSRGGERGVTVAHSLITSSNNKCPNCDGRKTEEGRVFERKRKKPELSV